MLTEIGPVEIEVPRGRDGSFELVVVSKRKRRLDGIVQIVLSLPARGLTTGEIAVHSGRDLWGRRTGSPSSRTNGASGIRPSCSSGNPSWTEFVPFLEYDARDPSGDLHDECDRVDQRPLPASGAGAWALPERAGRVEVSLPRDPGP